MEDYVQYHINTWSGYYTVSKRNMADLEFTQGTMVKRFLGIRERSPQTPLLTALDIPRISDCITLKTFSLFSLNLQK